MAAGGAFLVCARVMRKAADMSGGVSFVGCAGWYASTSVRSCGEWRRVSSIQVDFHSCSTCAGEEYLAAGGDSVARRCFAYDAFHAKRLGIYVGVAFVIMLCI